MSWPMYGYTIAVHTTMKSKCSVLLRFQSMELRIKLLPAKGAVKKYMLLNFFNNMTLNSLVELICMLAIALPAGRNSRTKYSHYRPSRETS